MSGKHYLPHLIVWCVSSLLLTIGMWRYRKTRAAVIGLLIAELWITIGLICTPVRIAVHVPRFPGLIARGGMLVIAVLTVSGAIVEVLWAFVPQFNPKRRAGLKTATMAAPALILGAGYVNRDRLRLVEFDLPIPGLPKDLHGLRIVQVSDLHLSPLVEEALVARAVDMANETRANIALVTGDLISAQGDPLDACIRQIARLRADAGVFGCMGNHEMYARCVDYTASQCARAGIPFLMHENRELRFGTATLNLAGVNYQPRHEPYLEKAEDLIVPGATNILMSHNPDVFPVAAAKGFQGVFAGHTHGGQINVEILDQSINVARFFTPFIYGVYSKDRSSMYVTRGVGTIGLPSRLGAPPEVALIRLCATSS